MKETTVLMGRFSELDGAADALEGLRALGLPDEAVEVISGYPYSAEMLGRPHNKSVVPLGLISLGSAPGELAGSELHGDVAARKTAQGKGTGASCKIAEVELDVAG